MKRGGKKKERTSDENVAESATASSTPRTLPPAKKAKIREPPGGDRKMDNRPAWLKQLEEAEATEKQATDAEFEAHLARVGGTLPDVSDGSLCHVECRHDGRGQASLPVAQSRKPTRPAATWRTAAIYAGAFRSARDCVH
jgi:hypothetical protein